MMESIMLETIEDQTAGRPYSAYLPMSPLLRARMRRCCGETPHQRRTVRLKVGMEV